MTKIAIFKNTTKCMPNVIETTATNLQQKKSRFLSNILLSSTNEMIKLTQ